MQWGFTSAAVAAAALLGAGSAVALEPDGDEFQANTYTLCNQLDPVITALDDGGFVIVWASGSSEYTQDGSISGVFGQRYAADGTTAGDEFRINQFTQDEQARPGVARRNGGGFVVVWHSWWQDGNGYGVFARRYRANGNPLGGEFAVNSYTPGWQEMPVVAKTADGFVVVWQSYDQDGDREGIYAQRYDDDGVKLDGEFRVNSYTRGSQERAGVSAAPDGRFVVVWMSGFDDGFEQDGDGGGIFAQRYAANGNAAGGEFRVNQVTLGDQARPAVAMADDGSFLVAWESKNVEGGGEETSDGVAARRFDASGAALGTQFLVNTYTTGPQEDCAVARAPNGEFVITWASYGSVAGSDRSGRSVNARRLDAAGSLMGDEFQVNTFELDDQEDAAVGALDDNGFVVAWESQYQDGHQAGVFAQRFSDALCGDGNRDGRVNATDALVMLGVSVGVAQCELCSCDVNGSGNVSATDALLVLRVAVGQAADLTCPPC